MGTVQSAWGAYSVVGGYAPATRLGAQIWGILGAGAAPMERDGLCVVARVYVCVCVWVGWVGEWVGRGWRRGG